MVEMNEARELDAARPRGDSPVHTRLLVVCTSVHALYTTNRTPESEALSKALQQAGMKFVVSFAALE